MAELGNYRKANLAFAFYDLDGKTVKICKILLKRT